MKKLVYLPTARFHKYMIEITGNYNAVPTMHHIEHVMTQIFVAASTYCTEEAVNDDEDLTAFWQIIESLHFDSIIMIDADLFMGLIEKFQYEYSLIFGQINLESLCIEIWNINAGTISFRYDDTPLVGNQHQIQLPLL